MNTTDVEERRRLIEEAAAAGDNASLAEAYQFLQQSIGVIAFALPFVLALGYLISGGSGTRGSVSGYYYTHLGNWFVGSLFAIGVFFFSYHFKALQGFEIDKWLTTAASIFAVTVALCPTAGPATHQSTGSHVVSGIHMVSACTLFVILAVMALFRFTLSDQQDPGPDKRRRNLVYQVCGIVMFACIVLVAIAVFGKVAPDSWHSLFWLESVMIIAFAVSWLVKGGFLGILADKLPPPLRDPASGQLK
jgi:hypothetical protein